MRTENIAAGMTTLLPYYTDSKGYHVSVAHEEMRMRATTRPLSPEDLDKMIALGWHQEYTGRNYSEDFSSKDYRPDEQWFCYV